MGFGIAGAIAAFFDVFATAAYTSYGSAPPSSAQGSGSAVGIPALYLPINMTGQTAASVSCGFSSDGLPIGLHIIGPRRAEERVLRASAAFERARPWADKPPPGFE